MGSALQRSKIAFAVAGMVMLFTPAVFAQLTPRQERNLTAFTKLYGYVRYFYPGDEAQQIDWDQFAVYGSKEVVGQRDDIALMAKLRQLYLPVAPAIKIAAGTAPIAFNTRQVTPPDIDNYKVISWQHRGYGVSAFSDGYASIRLNRRGALTQKQMEESRFIPMMPQLDVKPYLGKAFAFTVKIKLLTNTANAQVMLLKDSMSGPQMLLKHYRQLPVKDTLAHTYRFTGVLNKDINKVIFGVSAKQDLKVSVDSLHFYVLENGSMAEVPLKKPVDYNELGPYVGLRRYALLVDDNANDKALFEPRAHIGESIQATLVKGINCMVPLAVYGNADATWPQAKAGSLNALKQGIASVKTLDKNSQPVHLADVLIAWNVFDHFFDYWDDVSVSPSTILHNALVKAAADKTEADIFYTLKKLCAALNDAHMFYNSPGAPGASDAVSIPLVFAKAEGRIVVKFVLDSTLNRLVHAGDVVDSLEGKTALAYYHNKYRYTTGSPQFREFNTLTLLPNGEMHSTANLVTDHNGIKTKLSIPRLLPGVAYREGSFSLKPLPDGEIKNGIYYYNLSDKAVDSIIEKNISSLVSARAVILDMRGYPKSDLMKVISHLLTTEEYTKWMHIAQIIYPDHQKRTYQHMGWNLKPLQPHINAKIYLLTDPSAISASDSYAGFFQDFKLATIIGQPTAGTNGNLNKVDLPGDRGQFFSGMLVTNHNGSKHHLRGIVPDIMVESTIKGIAQGRDEILEQAIIEAGKN